MRSRTVKRWNETLVACGVGFVLAACATPPIAPPSVPDVGTTTPRLSPVDGGCAGYGDDVCCDSSSFIRILERAQANTKVDGGRP